jgi:hypothetical protein
MGVAPCRSASSAGSRAVSIRRWRRPKRDCASCAATASMWSRRSLANSADTKSLPGPVPEPAPPVSRPPLKWALVAIRHRRYAYPRAHGKRGVRQADERRCAGFSGGADP